MTAETEPQPRSVPTPYGRACSVCSHPELPEIDAALSEGVEIVRLVRRFSLGRDALYRHVRLHLGPALREHLSSSPEFSAATLVERIADIANSARAARVEAYGIGNRPEGIRAGDAELRALAVLSDRFKVGSDEVAAQVSEAAAIARAVRSVAANRPELGEALALAFETDDRPDLADEMRTVAAEMRRKFLETTSREALTA